MGTEGLGGIQNNDWCLPCLRGWHTTCRQPCKCKHQLGETVATIITGDAGTTGPEEATDVPDSKRSPRVRRTKRDDALKDQQSTGRKRAAQLYPFLTLDGRIIKRGDGTPDSDRRDCEWAGKDRCGGGTNPIKGCGQGGLPTGKQHARHHGPDKNTLNNEEGNVHRICHSCHNRWHAANDPDYDPNKPLKH